MPSGKLDASFGNDGLALFRFSTFRGVPSTGHAVAINPTSGSWSSDRPAAPCSWQEHRNRPADRSRKFDPSFSGDGREVGVWGAATRRTLRTRVRTTPAGGSSPQGPARSRGRRRSSRSFAAARTDDGETTFSGDGVVRTSFGISEDFANGVAIDSARADRGGGSVPLFLAR